MARVHLRVKDLIEKLQELPPDAKVIFENQPLYEEGMYYATEVILHDTDPDEIQVEIGSNHATIALNWDFTN